jgi:uncharacterized protein YodC (DUF2158 family)
MSHVKNGDLVLMKSGGPVMSVGNVVTESDGRIRLDCDWFADEGDCRRVSVFEHEVIVVTDV